MKAKQSGDTAERVFQRAMVAQSGGQFTDAERLYRLAMGMAPGRTGPRHNLGVLMRGLGRLEEARDLLSAVIARDPSQMASRYVLGMVLMGLGDYASGWPLYEARRGLPELKIHTPALPFPEWKGEALKGRRIVLFPEQGLGDNIQFARFATVLRDRGAEVLLLCRPPLKRILQASLDGVEVQAAEGSVEMGAPDFWALFGSVPGPLSLTVDTLPDTPYLFATPAAGVPSDQRLRIGLVTRGSPVHQNDARRSLLPTDAVRLLNLPGVVVSLHPEDSRARDFAETAAIIAGLDVVVTVDTSVAHLSGAMGKPTFVLIPGFGTDWRWLQHRADSPWYPTLTLFRSALNGDWSAALTAVEAAVHALPARQG